MAIHQYKFTVFTPTFNRAKTLKNVYDCLLEQTYKSFEWLIVNDGSTDETHEIVSSWIREKRIAIKYIHKENGGKHRAFNIAINNAQGEWFICLDSDDIYISNALATLNSYSKMAETIENIGGMPCLSADFNGNVIGTKFPTNNFVTNHFNLYYKYKATGDKGFIYKTSVLKEFPFPEFPGENFLTEAIVLNRISRKYNILCVNEPLQRVNYQIDGLTSSMKKLRLNNPRGFALFHNEKSLFDLQLADNFINGSLYVKYSFLAKYSLWHTYKNSLEKRRFLIYLLLGSMLFIKSKIFNYKWAKKRF
tara:strand:- start:6854 stop:7771 length:918 start_codon:yes stop_codon:yes gene_type:complete